MTSKIISNAKDAADVYGDSHPFTLISYVMDFVAKNYGYETRVSFRKLNGKVPQFREIHRLWNEGRLCWCIQDVVDTEWR